MDTRTPAERLSPTEQRFHDLMADGRLHRCEELVGLLYDELSDQTSMRVHIANLRVKLRGWNPPLGVACERIGTFTSYRLVVLTDGGYRSLSPPSVFGD